MWIIDASAACKLYLEEPESDLAMRFCRENAGALFAPDLLLAEVANGILKPNVPPELGPRLPLADAKRALRDLAGRVKLSPTAPAAMEVAMEMAAKMRHHLHDCVYLAQALADDRALVTADMNFLRKARETEWAGLVLRLPDALARPA